MDSVIFARKGAETKRFHTHPVLHAQNIAEHSHGVAMLCSYFALADPDPGLGAALLMAALTHDLAEWQMGDMPSPAKRNFPNVALHAGREPMAFRKLWGAIENAALDAVGLSWENKLTPKELRWLKLADAADGCFYCIRERAMGNQLITPVWNNFIEYYQEIYDAAIKTEADLYRYLVSCWAAYSQ